MEESMLDNIATTAQIFGGVGQFIGGIGLLIAGLTAYRAYRWINRTNLDMEWDKRAHELYHIFWMDKGIESVRKLITYEDEYNNIKDILEIHANKKGLRNVHTEKDDKVTLENIDKFCALLLLISNCLRVGETSNVNKDHINKWKAVFYNYWIDIMIERPELMGYLKAYWTNLHAYITQTSNRT
jgi:hypothetical protein